MLFVRETCEPREFAHHGTVISEHQAGPVKSFYGGPAGFIGVSVVKGYRHELRERDGLYFLVNAPWWQAFPGNSLPNIKGNWASDKSTTGAVYNVDDRSSPLLARRVWLPYGYHVAAVP